MALAPITPRDKLQRLVDLGRKTLRYWWLIAVFSVVGGGLSLAFATSRPRNYQSWATLFYQERITSALMSPNREEAVMRNIGDRFRELLLARVQLEQIVSDPKLNQFPADDPEVAIDKLRLQIRFEAKGTNAFRITYGDSDPDRAKLVTEKLTKLLQDKDESLRNELASATANFAIQEKEKGSTELQKAEQALAEFLAKHPEFVQDANQAQTEGASIRASRNAQAANTGNSRLDTLERQKHRIQARLDAPPDAPPIRTPAPQTPERTAAEGAVQESQRELQQANREVEDALAKFTDNHPSVRNARDRVAAAQQRLRHAQAAVPPELETMIVPATPQDRAKLQKELSQLESQIADEQKRTGKTPAANDAATDRVVKLETQHALLRRSVNEQRERVDSLAASVFRAQIDASQKLAETGGRLAIVDPAFRPVKPSGPGKTIFLLAGMILFVSLGFSLAIGLAVIDDRLYRRADLDQLNIAVLAVIPRGRTKFKTKRRKQAAS